MTREEALNPEIIGWLIEYRYREKRIQGVFLGLRSDLREASMRRSSDGRVEGYLLQYIHLIGPRPYVAPLLQWE